MVTPAGNGWLRWVTSALLAVLSGLWLVISPRVIAVPLYVVFMTLLIASVRGSSRRRAVVAFIVFLIATLSPVDLSFRAVDGPPRIVPYVMGLPGRVLLEKAARGEVVLGGCVVSGFEPRWVIVW